MFALWLLFCPAPDLRRLGADDFDTREAETRRCDNVLLALLLPASDEDPEVNYRIRWLRGRNLRLLDRDLLDLACFRACFGNPARTRELFRALPLPPGEHGDFLWGRPVPTDWLRWKAYLDYHRGVAPMPRAKDPDPESQR